jgi:hypothetical protein
VLLLELFELPRPIVVPGANEPTPPTPRIRRGGWDEREIGDYEPGDSRPREKDARHLLLAFEELRAGIDAERGAHASELHSARAELAKSRATTQTIVLVGSGLALGAIFGGARGVLIGGAAGAGLALVMAPKVPAGLALYAWAQAEPDGSWRVVDGPHWFTPKQAAEHLPSAPDLERMRWVAGAWTRDELAAPRRRP